MVKKYAELYLDARRALLAVTREDVRDILKQFTLSVSCLLTREEGNGNG